MCKIVKIGFPNLKNSDFNRFDQVMASIYPISYKDFERKLLTRYLTNLLGVSERVLINNITKKKKL